MTIEVRQMLIRTVVVDAPEPAPDPRQLAAALERLRVQLLAECKALLAEQRQRADER